MIRGKKGAWTSQQKIHTFLFFVVVIAVVYLVASQTGLVGGVQRTALPQPSTTIIQDTATATASQNLASVTVIAKAERPDWTPVQFALSSAYAWDESTPTTQKLGTSGTTTSATVTTTISGVAVGSKICTAPISASYYPVLTGDVNPNEDTGDNWKTCTEVSTAGASLEIKVYNATTGTGSGVEVQLYEDGEPEGYAPSITMDASSQDSFTKFSLKTNLTDRYLYMAGVCFGTPHTDSNVTKIALGSSGGGFKLPKFNVRAVTSSDKDLSSSIGRDNADWCYLFDKVLVLKGRTEYLNDFPEIIIDTDASFAGSEKALMWIIDANTYAGTDGAVHFGVRKDDTGASDVGISDFNAINFTITA